MKIVWGADICSKDRSGNTPLQIAQSCHHKDVADLITAWLAGDIYDISSAAKNGDLAKVKALVEKYPDMLNVGDRDGIMPLHWPRRGAPR
jgi:ankyrin repeat protein